MKKDDIVRRKKPVLYSLFLLGCICLLSGCTSVASNLSSNVSAASSKATQIVTQPTPTPDPTQAKAQQLLSKMSLNDKLAQMIMVEFLGSDYAGSGLQQMVAQQHVGGFLYQDSDGNFAWPNNTVDGTQSFSAQATADDTTAPLIAIDQEGGTVSKTSTFLDQHLLQKI